MYFLFFIQMEEWEEQARNCMQRVPFLEGDINNKVDHIMALERRIGELKNQPQQEFRPVPPPKKGIVKRLLQFLIIILPLLLVLLLLVSIVAVYSLDDNARYRFFRQYQHLPFIQFTDLRGSSSRKLVL